MNSDVYQWFLATSTAVWIVLIFSFLMPDNTIIKSIFKHYGILNNPRMI